MTAVKTNSTPRFIITESSQNIFQNININNNININKNNNNNNQPTITITERRKVETLLLYCCNFFSSFCCLLLLITASGLLMLRVKDVSGSSGEFKDYYTCLKINIKIYCGEVVDKLINVCLWAWPTFQSALQKFFACNLQCYESHSNWTNSVLDLILLMQSQQIRYCRRKMEDLLQIVILFSRKEYLKGGGNVELDYIEIGTKYLNNGPRNIFDKYTNFVLKIRKILKIYKYF